MTTRNRLVTDQEQGERLDRFVVDQLKNTSRVSIQRWIEEGLILVNGKPSKPSHKLHAGDSVTIELQETQQKDRVLEPWNFPLEILYEDTDLLAINKPSGMITHPGAGVNKRTVANAALFLRPEIADIGHQLRPGVVHRLDKETSGLLLLAKSPAAYYKLSEMFKERKIEKHYRALAYGKFAQKEGRIDTALGRDPANRKKISTRSKRSRAAVTEFRVLKEFDFAALLDIRIHTGRTHQIRVHLSSINHPIVGDTKYGGGDWNRIRDSAIRNEFMKNGFFGLHAESLSFQHPITGAPINIQAPLPATWSSIS